MAYSEETLARYREKGRERRRLWRALQGQKPKHPDPPDTTAEIERKLLMIDRVKRGQRWVL